MPNQYEEKELRQRMGRMETLLEEVERFADSAARAKMREIVQTLLDMHGAALERIFASIANKGPVGVEYVEELARDELIGSLLNLYGLHPQDMETRIRGALDSVRPALQGHGGNVELLAISDDGVVRLRMEGSCHGCPSSAQTLRQTIEEAIYARAPDVSGIEVEGVVDEPAHSRMDFTASRLNGKVALPLVGG
jgi:Fe-S cluster biogenesis protein NfuA